MILTGSEILKLLGKDIIIEPFNRDQLNPNSYNLTLDNKMLVYNTSTLDMKVNNATDEIIIPPEGIVLQPGELYLAQTSEYTETHSAVPIIIGRSSISRLGISIHSSGGFGDVGFCGRWTLSMSVVKPVRVYAGVKICQIYYHAISGNSDTIYTSDKYQNNDSVQASRLFYELQE